MPFDAAWHSDDARRAVDALLRPAAGRAPCSITTVLIRGGEADVDVLFSPNASSIATFLGHTSAQQSRRL